MGTIHRPSLTTECTHQAAQARDQLMGTGTGQSGSGCPHHIHRGQDRGCRDPQVDKVQDSSGTWNMTTDEQNINP